MKSLLLVIFLTCCRADDFSERARNFSIEILHFTQKETNSHVVISPFGIWSLLSGITLGAGGESRKQLRRAAFLPDDDQRIIDGHNEVTDNVIDPSSEGVELSSKNFMFINKNFVIKSNYRNILTKNFNAILKSLDFSTPEEAARLANNLIRSSGATVSNVLKADDFQNSQAILTNAIGFKGRWTLPFNVSDTAVEAFYDENKNKLGEVNMMYSRDNFGYSNVEQLKSTVLELPYGDGKRYSMLIILPYPKIKVTEIYAKLESVSLPSIFEKLKNDLEYFGAVEVDARIPRFKISTNVVLNKPLNSMGVYDIFESHLANFSRITDINIYITSIVHKADIEVTEAGTVASASTTADFSDRSLPPTFEANRPFIYFIMERPTSSVIFGGIYYKPSVF